VHQFATDVSASGEVVFTQIEAATRGDVWLRSADGRLTPVVRTAFDERGGVLSPDGGWLAYLSDESGRWQVYLKNLKGSGRSVASQGAAVRTWWLDGGRLAYTTQAGALVEAHVTAEGAAGPGTPRAFDDHRVIAVSGSGTLLLSRRPPPLPPAIVSIEAWRDIWRSLPPAVGQLPR
jgi:hypothetical protein